MGSANYKVAVCNEADIVSIILCLQGCTALSGNYSDRIKYVLLKPFWILDHLKGPVPGGLSYQNTRFQSTIIPKNSHQIYKIQISF